MICLPSCSRGFFRSGWKLAAVMGCCLLCRLFFGGMPPNQAAPEIAATGGRVIIVDKILRIFFEYSSNLQRSRDFYVTLLN